MTRLYQALALMIMFALGYISAILMEAPSSGTSQVTSESELPNSQNSHAKFDLDNDKSELSSKALTQSLEDESVLGADSELANDSSLDIDLSDSAIDSLELFSRLMTVQNTSENYALYGKLIDQIRIRLNQSDAELISFTNSFENYPIESRESYLIVSVLQGLPDNKGREALEQLATQTLSYSSEDGNRQFLEIVGRTGLVSEAIVDGLKQLALYGEKPENQVNALDMLMPFQVSDTETLQILDNLDSAIDNTQDPVHQSYLFSQKLRFLASEQKSELASAVLNDPSSGVEQMAIILGFIESGQIQRNTASRNSIIAIAEQADHPLQDHAIQVLMSSFDLQQEEYERLLQGKDINQFIIR